MRNEEYDNYDGEGFLEFWDAQAAWSSATFGDDRGPIGPLKHLRKEVEEALNEAETGGLKLRLEIVDCFILTLDAARRSGMSPTGFLSLAFNKLEINKSRSWPKPTSDEPAEHDRSKDARI